MEISPGRGRKRGGGAAKRVKVTLDEDTKMTAHGGFWPYQKGDCIGYNSPRLVPIR